MSKDIARGAGFLIGIIVIMMIIAAASLAWRYYTAEVRGVVDAQETTQSGNYRIAQYNHFFDLCASVQSYEDKIDVQQNQFTLLDEREGASERDITRTTTNIAGLQGQRSSVIRQYNADARKAGTIGQFRDSNLPYSLPTGTYTGDKTSCE